MNKELLNRIDSYINSHRNEIINDLRLLVKIPSVRGDEKIDAPYGEQCKKALEKSLELFEKNGFRGRFADSKKYIIAENEHSGKTIGLFAHCDVVSAEGEWLYGEPFKLTEREGFLIGRGCNDDKSGIIQMLYSAKMIKELNIPMNNKLLFFVGACEEDGMDDIADFVKNENMPDLSIVPDGEYPYYSAEKSRTRLMLESCIPFERIKNIQGGTCYNVILNRVNIEYNDGSKFEVAGTGGHAGHPEGSENALVKYIETSLDDDRLSDSDKEILKDVHIMLNDCYGGGLGVSHTDDFWGKLTCANGIVRVREGKLQISLDIRYGQTIKDEEIQETIQKRLKGRWKVVDSTFATGYIIDENSQSATTIKNVYSSLSGIACECGIKTAGGTYSKYLTNSFSIGTVMPHPELSHGFKEGHGEVHAPDEAMSEIGFLESIKTLLVMILEIDKIL